MYDAAGTRTAAASAVLNPTTDVRTHRATGWDQQIQGVSGNTATSKEYLVGLDPATYIKGKGQ